MTDHPLHQPGFYERGDLADPMDQRLHLDWAWLVLGLGLVGFWITVAVIAAWVLDKT